MKETYKKPLSIEEQTDYIRVNKNVCYETISEREAQLLLYEHNYINLITPYKHRFARKRKDGSTIRDINHNHIYPDPVDFSKYYLAYIEERSTYPIIYSNIMRFETVFNAIVSYETINYYKISSHTAFMDFLEQLKLNLLSMSANDEYSCLQIDNMRREINDFSKNMNKYDDIYIFMDRLSLSQLITVFRCVEPALRSKVFKALLESNSTIGYKTFSSFDEALTRIVPIRNCVCHSNSLEVLIMYLRIKQKSLRTVTDRKKYRNLVKKLSLD